MGKIKDRTGERYGRLTVISIAYIKIDKRNRSVAYWNCECDCGNKKVVCGKSLVSGGTSSCGCYRNEQVAKAKHNKIAEITGKDRINILGDIALISLTGTCEQMICDAEDVGIFEKNRWAINHKGYARCRMKVGEKRRTVFAHRLIVKAPDGKIVDHINRNRLDNRKSNLRIVDAKANRVHSELRPGNKSGYAGVQRQSRSWASWITIDGKYTIIGHFKTREEAINARRKAEIEIYGVYSNENYIE